MKTITLFVLLCFPIYITAQKTTIHEEKFIPIGGIEQWITIKGEDSTKPVILFIHGGPGSTLSQYDDAMYGDWAKDFILVNWDQRGAGKTYGKNAPSELSEDYLINNPLTVEQMANDGIELTKYLLKHLNKRKVILVSTSWGSILGIKMALSNPEFYHAYVGHSQFVNFSKNMDYAYQTVYKMSKQANDTETLQTLESIGKPPYDNAKSYGQLLRIVKTAEQANATPAPDTWFKISPAYNNEKDRNDRYNGDDYSFINFVGHEKMGIKPMGAEINFDENALKFKIPMYFIQGAHDILTAKAINKPYYDALKAPKKDYFLLHDAAHGHNQSVVDKQYEVLKGLELLE